MLQIGHKDKWATNVFIALVSPPDIPSSLCGCTQLFLMLPVNGKNRATQKSNSEFLSNARPGSDY